MLAIQGPRPKSFEGDGFSTEMAASGNQRGFDIKKTAESHENSFCSIQMLENVSFLNDLVRSDDKLDNYKIDVQKVIL